MGSMFESWQVPLEPIRWQVFSNSAGTLLRAIKFSQWQKRPRAGGGVFPHPSGEPSLSGSAAPRKITLSGVMFSVRPSIDQTDDALNLERCAEKGNAVRRYVFCPSVDQTGDVLNLDEFQIRAGPIHGDRRCDDLAPSWYLSAFDSSL